MRTLIISLLFVIFGYFYFVEGMYVDTATIGIKNIKVSEENISIEGFTTSSATGFSKYTYYIQNDNLYLKLKYSLVNKVNSEGDFNLTIHEPSAQIRKIFIQGRDQLDQRLVWEKD